MRKQLGKKNFHIRHSHAEPHPNIVRAVLLTIQRTARFAWLWTDCWPVNCKLSDRVVNNRRGRSSQPKRRWKFADTRNAGRVRFAPVVNYARIYSGGREARHSALVACQAAGAAQYAREHRHTPSTNLTDYSLISGEDDASFNADLLQVIEQPLQSPRQQVEG